MRIGSIAMGLMLLLPISGQGQEDAGTICVAPRALTPFRGQVVPATGKVSSGGMQVKIDKRAAVPWPQRESLKIEGLDLKERHLLMVVTADGKPVESLWFRFTSYHSSRLCTFYDGYGGIDLRDDGKKCPWCRCKYGN